MNQENEKLITRERRRSMWTSCGKRYYATPVAHGVLQKVRQRTVSLIEQNRGQL